MWNFLIQKPFCCLLWSKKYEYLYIEIYRVSFGVFIDKYVYLFIQNTSVEISPERKLWIQYFCSKQIKLVKIKLRKKITLEVECIRPTYAFEYKPISACFLLLLFTRNATANL